MDSEPPTATEADALTFLETGAVPGLESPSEDDRVAFARACLKHRAFKEKAWPDFACFVDASNVARRRQVDVVAVNADKASMDDLESVVAALKRLRYVPLVVSDGNLFYLIDRPFEFRDKFTKPPHSVAEKRQADNILLHALRRIPEAACVTNDRFAKADEMRRFGDVIGSATFYRHRWDGDAPRFVTPDGTPAIGAFRRLARRVGALAEVDAPHA